MFTARFKVQKKDYSYSAQVNFAERGEKVEIDPKGYNNGGQRKCHIL